MNARVTSTYRNHMTGVASLDQIAIEELAHAPQRLSAEVPLHLANALSGEESENSAMPVVPFLAIRRQPSFNQWRHPTLLCPDYRMLGVHGFSRCVDVERILPAR
jgi:hypothetical protein